MAKIIIEEINRLGHCTERHKFDHFPIHIGRGYQNDIILADPHVSPEHAIIHESDDETDHETNGVHGMKQGWRIEDCNSHNGIQIKHHSSTTTPEHVYSGDDIVLGRVRLRVFSPSHTVAHTHNMPTSEAAEKLIARPLTVISILIVTLVTMLLNKQLQTASIIPTEKLVASVLPVLVGILFWAGAWSFAGRLMKHKTNFLIHLSITSLFSLCLIIINILGEYIAFNSGTSTFAQIVEFIIMGIALLTLLSVNIENATTISHKTRRITSHAITWGFLVFAVFMDYASQPEFTRSPSFTSTLKPPFAKVVGSASPSEFLAESASIFKFEDTH